MLNAEQLIADFEDCIGFPYASPGTNDERGIDCSGMFVRAFRLQGASIYHGSNTIWRRYLSRKGRITGEGDLTPGMAVFKWKEDTPSKFDDNEGDFCHIGLVTHVSPLRIVHASTEGMQVKADTKLGKWRYWGWLRDVVEDEAQTDREVTYPTLCKGSRGENVRTLQTLLNACGASLDVDGIFGSKTRRAVKQFQAANGLETDGIAGKNTWAALMKETEGLNE